MGYEAEHPYRELLRLFVRRPSLVWVGAIAIMGFGRQYSAWFIYDGGRGTISPLTLLTFVSAILTYVAFASLSRRLGSDEKLPGEARWGIYSGLAFAITMATGLIFALWSFSSTEIYPYLSRSVTAVLGPVPTALSEALLLFAPVKLVCLAIGRDRPFAEILHFLFRGGLSLTIYYAVLCYVTTGSSEAFAMLVDPGETNGAQLSYVLATSAISGVTEILRILFPIVVFRALERESATPTSVFS